MNSLLHNRHRVVLSTSLLLGSIGTIGSAAHAAVSAYDSFATLTYIINSIHNLTNPGDLSALDVQASFEQAGAPWSFVYTTGDGTVTAANGPAGPAPLTVGSTFSYTFTVSGGANNGTLDASHTGWYGLTFANTGTDDYDIGVTLDYQLSSGASGQSAASTVSLDYFNHDSSFSGTASVSATSAILPNDTHAGTSGLFDFVLQGFASEALLADAVVTGNLEASGTPVPLPPAAWSFLASSLMAAGLGYRRKKTAIAPEGQDQ